jgi:hypothetical protein
MIMKRRTEILTGVVIGAGAFLAMLLLIGCTENKRAKVFGGTIAVQLPPGRKLVNATWKGEASDLWYLTRPMRPGESAEEWVFTEKSAFGFMQGSVVFQEQVVK